MERSEDGDGWRCSHCGHHLNIDQLLQLSDLPGQTFSGAGMTPAAMALYIRSLELRWMGDQRDLRVLRRQLTQAGITPATEYLEPLTA